jgi:iron complex transport system ATP-binding protein
MIKAEGIVFSYGQIRALDGLSLALSPGSFYGIIGPNGSGKSTLLMVMAGILAPQSGTVALQGRPLQSFRAKERARILALVLQDNFFPFDFNALDVVLMGRSPYLGPLQDEGPTDLEAARQAMDICDCWQLRRRSIKGLSGGERQRVVLARALAQQPQVILMDEPANHLDLSHQARILDHIGKLCRERSLAAAAVFHDLNLASRFCDRLFLLDRGRLVCQGQPSQVVDPGTIRQVYRSEVCLLHHPSSGKPVIVLV